MSLSIVRFIQSDNISAKRDRSAPCWGILEGKVVYPLTLPCKSTGELLAHDPAELRQAKVEGQSLPLDKLQLLSPITRDAKVMCLGANYRQHMIDSGMDPDVKRFNMMFTKSSASIHHPVGEIIRPKHVDLLDYEVELTLVLGKETNDSVTVTQDNLHEYVAGVCIGNDISARDVQIPQMQFHKGKSYRTFCPLGPILCLLEKHEIQYLDNLQLSLSVNGELRQNDSTANLVYKPAESLTELSQIADFKPGDVLMTGTPSGCALGLPSPFIVRTTALLPDHLRYRLFHEAQRRRSQYLKDGDIVEASIFSSDGKINLGIQKHKVVSEG
ncbi:MAG: fumarylacetoacetate hydrolase family protein [Hahellaceae bacterium]|nr:fumarylacetoacetate hydrolase family protein [Hahellaceae bacterium]